MNKKNLIFVLLFALTVVFTVTAQEEPAETGRFGELYFENGSLKFLGELKTGARMETTTKKKLNAAGNEDSYRSTIYGYSDDLDNGTALRADLSAIFNSGPAGLKFTVRQLFGQKLSSFLSDDIKYPYLNNAYGYLNLFNGSLRFHGGIIDDPAWGTKNLGDTETDTDIEAGKGLRISIQPPPIPGLSFGAFWNLNGVIYDPNGIVDINKQNTVTPEDGMYTIDQLLGESLFGLLYKSPIFGLSYTAKMNRPVYYSDGVDVKKYERGYDMLFGAKITAINNLLIALDGQLKNIGYSGDAIARYMIDPRNGKQILAVTPSTELFAKAEYLFIEKITVGVLYSFKDSPAYDANGAPLFTKDNIKDYSAYDMGFRIYGAYQFVPAIKAGLEVQANIVSLTKEQRDNNPDVTGIENYSTFKGVSAKPYAEFRFNENLKVTLYDTVTFYAENYGGVNANDNQQKAGTGNYKIKRPSYIGNILHLDLIWSF
ncbi:MAG: hypothetical protein LBC77_05930 [Spirochaetaceae bacterium]|jgi:hypothetical protein|nr:hypothetical protein [Spirochaetaceae bacterium]